MAKLHFFENTTKVPYQLKQGKVKQQEKISRTFLEIGQKHGFSDDPSIRPFVGIQNFAHQKRLTLGGVCGNHKTVLEGRYKIERESKGTQLGIAKRMIASGGINQLFL